MSAGDNIAAVLRKNATEELRVGHGEFNGFLLVSLRVWADNRNGGDRIPTKAGFNFSLHRIGELIAALPQVQADAEAGVR